MNSTVVVAALGLLTTLAAAGVTAYLQRSSLRESRIFDARMLHYADLAAALYDYERATYSRVKARIDHRPDSEREPYRIEAWTSNGQARAAIGVVALLSADVGLHSRFDKIRRGIGDLNRVSTQQELVTSHEALLRELEDALRQARQELMP